MTERYKETPPTAPFPWNAWQVPGQPFHLGATLTSGQSFRWRRDAQGVWWGVVGTSVLAAWQTEGRPDSPLFWQTFPQPDQRALVEDYFRLDVPLERLYARWIQAEPRLAAPCAAYRGLRILRQPPRECLFGFLCATCNTVTKIERSVFRLAERYGEPIPLEGKSRNHGEGESTEKAQEEWNRETNQKGSGMLSALSSPSPFFAFPTLEALAGASEVDLRADKWGYRAPLVIGMARHLRETRSDDWLLALRFASYPEAHSALTELRGIGAKLADCIALFCLDKDGAVPVDTHVRQIAERLWMPEIAGRSLTSRLYTTIADSYRTRFGEYAGWAQQYLFFGELRHAPDYACDDEAE